MMEWCVHLNTHDGAHNKPAYVFHDTVSEGICALLPPVHVFELNSAACEAAVVCTAVGGGHLMAAGGGVVQGDCACPQDVAALLVPVVWW